MAGLGGLHTYVPLALGGMAGLGGLHTYVPLALGGMAGLGCYILTYH